MIAQALCPVLLQREDEVGRLEDALLAARRGEGEVVVVAGDAGIGKTRLANEARRRAVKLGFETMSGTCAQAELTLPYLPFIDAVGNYLNRADLDDLRRELAAACIPLAQIFPQLSPGPGAAGAAGIDGGDPDQARLRLYEAFLTMFRVAADRGGLLLILEDLHWADASTRELLDYVARRLPGIHAVVLASYRLDELHRNHPLLPILQGWRRGGLAEFVELRPLDRAGVAGMARAIFDDQVVSAEFRDFLYSLSDGNPLVVEETLKWALDRGDIYRTETGDWDRKAITELRVPRTLTDSVLHRVEALGAPAAEVLRCAAVLGRSFDYGSVVAVSGLDDREVEAAVGLAIEQQLIEEDSDSPGHYRFRHSLTREAVYDDMPRPKRERLHSAVATALQATPGSAAMDVANHLLAAGRGDEAVPVCVEAGEQAMRDYAYREAVGVWERALHHVADAEAAARLRCRVGEAYLLLDDAPSALEYLDPGITALEGLGRRAEAAAFRLLLGRAHWLRMNSAEALRQYEMAREALEPEGPSEALAAAYVRLGAMAAFDWDYPRTRALCEKAIEVAEAAGAQAQRIWALGYLGSALIGEGKLDEGLEMMDGGWKEAIDLGLPVIAANGLHNAIVARMVWMRAREGLELLQVMRSLPPTPFTGGLTFLEANLRWALGELAEAHRLSVEDRERAIEADDAFHRSWAEKDLCWIDADSGDFDELEAVLPPLDWSLRGQDLFDVVYCHVCQLLARGKPAEAAAVAAQSLEFLHTMVTEPSIPDLVVTAFALAGDVEKARAVADYIETQAPRPEHPWLRLAVARSRLCEGRLEEALDAAGSAVSGFVAAGYRVREACARTLTGQVLAARGDGEGAAASYTEALRVARECGAWARADEAAEGLTALGRAVPPAPVPEPVSTFAMPPAEAGERLVTVLFADIRGYTAMAAASAPADVAEKIATLQRWARQEVGKRHGVVDKFAGDAVMASFNIAGARLDHATLALEAALSLVEKAALMDLPVGAGIATGPAVVGRLTGGANLSVLGDATNLASRLQAQAAAGEVLLSAEAHRRVRDWLAEQRLEVEERELTVKGLEQPVRAFAVRALVPVVR